MNLSVVIRPAQAQDLAVLEGFIDQQPLGTGWNLKSVRESLENPQDSIWLALNEESRAQGLLIARVVAGEAELLNIVVASQKRRQGLGLALVEQFVLAMKQACVSRIFLEVRVSNQAAIRLYRRFNFKEVGRRKRYYQPDQEDALVLSCLL